MLRVIEGYKFVYHNGWWWLVDKRVYGSKNDLFSLVGEKHPSLYRFRTIDEARKFIQDELPPEKHYVKYIAEDYDGNEHVYIHTEWTEEELDEWINNMRKAAWDIGKTFKIIERGKRTAHQL